MRLSVTRSDCVCLLWKVGRIACSWFCRPNDQDHRLCNCDTWNDRRRNDSCARCCEEPLRQASARNKTSVRKHENALDRMVVLYLWSRSGWLATIRSSSHLLFARLLDRCSRLRTFGHLSPSYLVVLSRANEVDDPTTEKHAHDLDHSCDTLLRHPSRIVGHDRRHICQCCQHQRPIQGRKCWRFIPMCR